MSPRSSYILIPAAFILGVAGASFISPSWILLPVTLCITLLVGIATVRFISGSNIIPSREYVLFVLAGLLACAAGIVVFYTAPEPQECAETLAERAPEYTEGVIVKEPVTRPDATQYYLKIDSLESLILVTTSRYPEYSYGDRIRAHGELLIPSSFADFDYRAFLQKEGVGLVMYYPEVELLSSGRGNRFIATLFSLKDRMRETLHRSVPYPNSTVIGAMTLGDGQYVPDKISDRFSMTGIRHITAISGMHITIMAGLLMVALTAFLKIPRTPAFVILAILIVLYVVFVGSPPSAIRAGVMGLVLIFAQHTGRTYYAGRALVVVAAGMLLFNPLLLRFDVGFQLSFMAVLGILFLSPFFHSLLRNLSSRYSVSFIPQRAQEGTYSLMAMTLGAHLATLPLVAHHFGVLSVAAPLTNILVVPLVPFILMSGFLLMIGGILLPVLAPVLGIPAYLLSQYVLAVSNTVNSLPHAGYTSLEIHWSIVAALYALATAATIYISRTSVGRAVLSHAVS